MLWTGISPLWDTYPRSLPVRVWGTTPEHSWWFGPVPCLFSTAHRFYRNQSPCVQPGDCRICSYQRYAERQRLYARYRLRTTNTGYPPAAARGYPYSDEQFTRKTIHRKTPSPTPYRHVVAVLDSHSQRDFPMACAPFFLALRCRRDEPSPWCCPAIRPRS